MLYLVATTAVIVLAWRVTPWIQPEGGPWLGAMTTVFFALAVVLGCVQLTGVLGFLHPGALTALPVCLLLGWMAWERGRRPEQAEIVSQGLDGMVAVIALGATMGLWFAGPGWSGTDFVFDDITYHAAVPVQWFLEGEIAYSTLTYQSYYPFNAELPGTWALVLDSHLGNSGAGILCIVALVVLAAVAFSENLGVGAPPVLALLAMVLTSTRMLHFSRTFSANDLTVTAYFLCALAFATAPVSRRSALWCGLALGAAIGAKISVAPGVLLIGLLWLWRSGRDPWLVVLLVGGSLVLGGYWYAHNLVQTGNPLFPAEIGPFEGPLDKAAQFRTSLLHFIDKNGGALWWRRLVRNRLAWPVWVGVASLAGGITALGAGFDKKRRGAWLALAIGLVMVAIHPMQPYSGTINRPNGTLHTMVRYLTLPTVLGLTLLASGTRRDDRSEQALTVVGLLGWMVLLASLFPDLTSLELTCLLAGAVGAFALSAMPRLPQGARFVLPVVALVAMMTWRGEAKKAFTLDKTVTFSPAALHHTAGWKAIDLLPPGRKVAWLSDLPSSHTFAIPLYGRSFQHDLIPVDRFGRRMDAPLHERWARSPAKWWSAFKNVPKLDLQVLNNLLASGADTLMVSRCQHSVRGPWPRPRQSMLLSGRSHRLYKDRCVEVWTLEPFHDLELVEFVHPGKKK